ncbi:MAG TPA: CHAD domain-containing protein [Allosphingosinicella sp.]
MHAREIELKLELASSDARRLGRLPALKGRSAPPVGLRAVYYDTPRGILRRAGYSLRVRRSGDLWLQTLKHRANGDGILFDRNEWEKKVAGMKPDFRALGSTPLARLLSGRSLRKLLAPRFEVQVERRSWTVRRGASEIEVVLDEGEAVAGGRSERVCEVELELKQGDKSALFDLAREFADAIPLRIGVRSKAERGYALANGRSARAGRATKAEPLGLEPGMPVAEAFASVVTNCLRHFRMNERAVERERDPDALHQARVAMRRLRSAMSLFRPAVAGAEHERIGAEFRWFTGHLGTARNLDVFTARLPSRFGVFQSAAEIRLRAALADRRMRAWHKAVEVVGSARLRRLLLDLVAWVETGDWRLRAQAAAPIDAFAGSQVSKRWTKVRKHGAGLGDLDEERLHDLRIHVKKLRYAEEFFVGLAPSAEDRERRRSAIAALSELQDSLGAINDIATARGLIESLGLTRRSERGLATRLLRRSGSAEEYLEKACTAFARLEATAEAV